MSKEAVDHLYRVASGRAAAGAAWEAICATVYADVLVVASTMDGDPEAALDGQALSATPVPEDSSTSAQALVDRMREILVASIPAKFRESATAAFGSTDFLAGLTAPATHAELTESFSQITGGMRVHDFGRSKATDSRVHATAARMMAEQEVDDLDIAAARRESDRDAFEAASVEFSIAHADWLLEGHRVRMDGVDAATAGTPLEAHEEFRAAAARQFDGLADTPAIDWKYATA